MKTEIGNVEETRRGFQIILFQDRYEKRCSLQQSSLAEFEPAGSSAIWLGIDQQSVIHDGIFDLANSTRMHLDLEQVKNLILVLDRWVMTGEFDSSRPDPVIRKLVE